MANTGWGNVYKKLGARPVINATGNQTVRGGSTPSATVRDAMRQADESYVEMEELLEKSGQFIAEQLGVETHTSQLDAIPHSSWHPQRL